MMWKRRGILVGGGAAFLAARPGRAGPYPDRPIRLVVPWPPGSSVDLSARAIGPELGRLLGQPVVVENRGGASGTIATGNVARAEPDGHTLVLGNAATHATAKVTFANLPYDPVADFVPLSMVHKNILCIALARSVPVMGFAAFLAYARENHGRLSYGTPGLATPHQLVGELLNQRAGLGLVHVPYRGGGLAVSDLVASQIPVSVASLPAVVGLAAQGLVRIVAVTDDRRYAALPDVPTVAETYPGLVVSGWGGLFAPKGTPPEIAARLTEATAEALRVPAVAAALEANGLVPTPSSGAELGRVLREEMASWDRLHGAGLSLR